MVAEFIHRQSPRSQGPFVYVNCVAISDEPIESTLFGHERGAFTTAVARKEGRLEAAAGGTASTRSATSRRACSRSFSTSSNQASSSAWKHPHHSRRLPRDRRDEP